jgi:glycine/D-amino acid oxidase-like deaminating enzyme
MRDLFHDWRAKNITSVLHEKRGGYANNTRSMHGLAKKVEDLGVRIMTGVKVLGFKPEAGSNSVQAVETDRGVITCQHVVIGAGPWVRDF